MAKLDVLRLLYETKPGRILLRPLVSRPVSELSGKLLDSRASKLLIKPFVKKNQIDCDDYILDDIESFNDFFCRRIRPELRNIHKGEDLLIAPCDGLLSVTRIREGRVLKVKQSSFTVRDLLRDRKLAKRFEGGYALVYRLCVNHYHRYIYFDSGKKYRNRRIEGIYHTVRPVALENGPVFVQNTREYAVIDSRRFGRCVQMEVGAMLVGRIVNRHKAGRRVLRGMEKGHFEYGGSTIIVLIPKDKAVIDRSILESKEEYPVQMGDVIGWAAKKN